MVGYLKILSSMLITILFFLIFLVALIYDKQKTIIAIYPITLLTTTLPLFVIGKTSFGLNFCVYSLIIIMSVLNIQNKYRKNPFSLPILVTVIGYILTFFYGAYKSSVYPFVTHIVSSLIPLALYPYFKSSSDINRFIKWLCLSFSIAAIYGVVEYLNGRNFIMYWLQTQTTFVIFHDHIDDFRFGYGRCNSFFDFPISFGDACAMMFSFMLFYIYAYKKYVLKYKTLIVILVLMIVGIFLSNSRAPMLAFVVGILHLPFFRSSKRTLGILAVLLIFVLFSWNNLTLIYDSILGMNKSGVEGSSVEMRNTQFLFCLDDFMRNPVFGGGFNRLRELQGDIGGRELMGGESQLFILMVDHGLMGLLSYFLTVVYMCFFTPAYLRRFSVIFTLAWVIAAFSSLTTGLTISFPMILLLLVYRANELEMIEVHQ